MRKAFFYTSVLETNKQKILAKRRGKSYTHIKLQNGKNYITKYFLTLPSNNGILEIIHSGFYNPIHFAGWLIAI